MGYRGPATAIEQKRLEAYQRLEEIDAYHLWMTGYSIVYIAGRAGTTTHFARRFLVEMADDPTALPPRPPLRQGP